MTAPDQLGFDAMLEDCEADNQRLAFERKTAHLPGTMAEAVPFLHGLIEQHHTAMMGGNEEEAFRLRGEASLLARKLNGGEPGYLAGRDSPGRVLERRTAAVIGEVPLWGQRGLFALEVRGIPVRIEQEGLYGIAASMFWLGFSARVIDRDRPFISPTGYRSFLGVPAAIVPGKTPADFARAALCAHIDQALGGKLVQLTP